MESKQKNCGACKRDAISLEEYQKMVASGKLNISDVPSKFRDEKIYQAAYQNVSSEEEKQAINKFLLKDIEAHDGKGDISKYDGLLFAYADNNPDVIYNNPELYYISPKCLMDIIDWKLHAYDIPFKFRTDRHYLYAMRPLENDRQDDVTLQEQELLFSQLQNDIIRCHEEGLKIKEGRLRAMADYIVKTFQMIHHSCG